MLLLDFVAHLNAFSPNLITTLTVADFVRFMSLASEVQHTAGLAMRLSPTRLPITSFLSAALNPTFPQHLIASLWRFSFDLLPACRISPTALIREIGLQPDLNNKVCERYMRSPVTNCLVCPSAPRLRVHSRLDGYIFDSDGVHTAETLIMNCPGKKCNTFYRPSYYTSQGNRCYYTSAMGRDPEILHVHCHFYMTRRLAMMFRSIQMLAHVSHFNIVNWFNQTYVDDLNIPRFSNDQAFSPAMSDAVCSDGLDLFDLLRHADRRGTQVSVSASGTDHLRFEEAMGEHLALLAAEGTRDRDHYCSGCVRIKQSGVDPDTGEEILIGIRAVVTDGLTIGHWRCSASTHQLEELAQAAGLPPPEGPCTQRLDNINDRFCPEHSDLLGNRCQAQPCRAAAVEGTKTCKKQEHIDAMRAFDERVKGNFSLTAILNRPGSNLPSDPTVHLNSETGEFYDLESLQQADESNRAHEATRDGGESQPVCKVCLSRCRTHNDQLIVGCCGVVLARKTFYHSESVSAVKHFIKETFPQGLPEVVFYDNACRLTEHIYHGDGDIKDFEGTVIPVDPFHHRSHAGSDTFCQRFTDPKLFPDIQENGKWIFNASAAELTNIWYGGFASMCRNMHSIKYNFFLEEMVALRNEWLIKKLEKRATTEFVGNGVL